MRGRSKCYHDSLSQKWPKSVSKIAKTPSSGILQTLLFESFRTFNSMWKSGIIMTIWSIDGNFRAVLSFFTYVVDLQENANFIMLCNKIFHIIPSKSPKSTLLWGSGEKTEKFLLKSKFSKKIPKIAKNTRFPHISIWSNFWPSWSFLAYDTTFPHRIKSPKTFKQ